MTQRMHYHCDCGDPECAAGDRSINEHEQPIVVYLVAGHVNGGGEIDESQLDPWIVNLLKQPISRKEFHAHCATRELRKLLALSQPTPEGAAAVSISQRRDPSAP